MKKKGETKRCSDAPFVDTSSICSNQKLWLAAQGLKISIEMFLTFPLRILDTCIIQPTNFLPFRGLRRDWLTAQGSGEEKHNKGL